MSKKIGLWIIIIFICEMGWPFNIIFPCSVEAIQLRSCEVGLEKDFCFFNANINLIGMEFSKEKIPFIISSLRTAFINGMNNINESRTKLCRSFIKFNNSNSLDTADTSKSIFNQFTDNKSDNAPESKCDGGLYCNWHIRYFLLGFSCGAWAIIIFYVSSVPTLLS